MPWRARRRASRRPDGDEQQAQDEQRRAQDEVQQPEIGILEEAEALDNEEQHEEHRAQRGERGAEGGHRMRGERTRQNGPAVFSHGRALFQALHVGDERLQVRVGELVGLHVDLRASRRAWLPSRPAP